MKKIPTLFERRFENHRIVEVLDKITPGCEEAFLHGEATIKIDGACCAIIDGKFYKRYDAKKGKKPPEGAIPCCDPDPVTGHWPHWVIVDLKDPADKWFIDALKNTFPYSSKNPTSLPNSLYGTYEAIGPHFNDNPYNLDKDMLHIHGKSCVYVPRTFDDVKDCLENTGIEGIVFWLNGEPVCKIKRTDFGLPWPIKESKN